MAYAPGFSAPQLPTAAKNSRRNDVPGPPHAPKASSTYGCSRGQTTVLVSAVCADRAPEAAAAASVVPSTTAIHARARAVLTSPTAVASSTMPCGARPRRARLARAGHRARAIRRTVEGVRKAGSARASRRDSGLPVRRRQSHHLLRSGSESGQRARRQATRGAGTDESGWRHVPYASSAPTRRKPAGGSSSPPRRCWSCRRRLASGCRATRASASRSSTSPVE